MSKVIVITGGTSGYGKASAKMFADKGEKVIAVSRNKSSLEQTKKELGVDIFAADVTKPNDWQALHDYIKNNYGRIDLLVNNAGAAISINRLDEQTFDQIDMSIDLNLKGTIYGCKVFMPMFKEQKSGTIINVSSICAEQSWPGFSVYAAAKAGMVSFTKSMIVELQSLGIRVSCLIPAAGDTNFCNASGISGGGFAMKSKDIAQVICDTFYMPDHIVVSEVTVWGIDQEIVPL